MTVTTENIDDFRRTRHNQTKTISHSEACRRAQLAFSDLGFRMFRREVGLFYDRRGTPRRLGTPGEADLQGFTDNGYFAACEIKTGKATRTRQQKAYAAAVTNAGGFYVVVRYSAADDGDQLIAHQVELFRQRTC